MIMMLPKSIQNLQDICGKFSQLVPQSSIVIYLLENSGKILQLATWWHLSYKQFRSI
jgi:hypothetical protein